MLTVWVNILMRTKYGALSRGGYMVFGSIVGSDDLIPLYDWIIVWYSGIVWPPVTLSAA